MKKQTKTSRLTKSSSRLPDSKPDKDSAVNADQARLLILNDPDFIYSKRFNYSLKNLKKRYPEEIPDRITAAVLMITEDDIQEIYDRCVKKLREVMNPDLE